MFLKYIEIKNFRSLRDVTIPFRKTTLLIGENNVGKTTVLEAVRMGLTRQSRKSSPFDEYDYYSDSNYNNPKESTGIEITFVFEEEHPGQWSDELIRSLGDLAQMVPTIEGQALYSVFLKIASRYEEAVKDYVFESQFLNPQRQPLPVKLQGPSSLSNFLTQVPVFYLSALRDISQSFSPKSSLWSRFVRGLDVPQDELEGIQSQLLELNQKIMESDPQLSKLRSSLDAIKNILPIGSRDSVGIQAIPSQAWELLAKAQVVLKGAGSEMSLPLSRHGQGTQSLSVILLFQAYMEIMLQSTYSKTAEPILALEEPEAHLHPHAVRAVSNYLHQIDCQQIITTHSPYFFQDCDPRDIRLLRKNGTETTVHYLKTSVMIEIPEHDALQKMVKAKDGKFSVANGVLIAHGSTNEYEEKALVGMFSKHGMEEKIRTFCRDSQKLMNQEDLQKLRQFVQRTRGEILFARAWFLAEGMTESILIPFFADLLGYQFDVHGVTTIEYRNNGSAGAFVKFADALGFPWVLLTDNDDQGKKTLSEISNLGFTPETHGDTIYVLPHDDMEVFLAREGFLRFYVEILGDDAPDGINDINEYTLAVAEMIKRNKVENAYRLVEILKERNFTSSGIPTGIRHLIERCVQLSNGTQ